jgi:hypothetical protein
MNDITKLAHDGEFLREYGKQYFIVFTEAFNIGRVKVEIVPMKNGGKESAVFYLTIQQMYSLCQDIKTGVFKTLVDADTGNYPAAYKFVTGESGDKHLNIGGGKVGTRIQISETSKNRRYLMAVSMQAIFDMADNFLLFSGITPTTTGSFFNGLVNEFNEGRKERSKYRVQLSASDSLTNETVETDETEAPVEKPSSNAEKPKAAETKNEPQPVPAESVEAVFTVTASGTMQTKGKFYVFEATTSDNESVQLYFNKEEADGLKWFDGFKSKAEAGKATMPIVGEKKGNAIKFKGVAK